MIVFKFKKIPQRKGLEGALDKSINFMMEDMAKRFTKEAKDHNCPHHPNQNSEVTISSTNRQIDWKLTKYCCQEFKDSVKLNMKH